MLWLLFVVESVAASAFDDAQLAARDGRYKDVVVILTQAIDSTELQSQELVTAYSNRGIAYSLLKAYGLAKVDLALAVELDPSHKLTQNHLGILAEHIDEDYVAAFNWYKKAADAGFAASQVNLGDLYRKGLGVEQDYELAFKYYKLAASQNYSMAYVPIGNMVMEGLGVGRNSGAAIEWLQRGRNEGVVEADFYLGQAYERGRGVSRDYVRAAELFRLAAMQGHGRAQNAIGYLYRRGFGVAQDYAEAVRWYQLAADQGVIQAANRLAWLYATCPKTSVCDGQKALVLANAVVVAEPSASNLDSLAAAHARTGDFDAAIDIIQQILLTPGANVAKYRNRLELYRQQRPYQL